MDNNAFTVFVIGIIPIIGFAVGFILSQSAAHKRRHSDFLERNTLPLQRDIANLLEDHTELGETRAWELAGRIMTAVRNDEKSPTSW